jgi:hypothetical protein
MYIQLCRPIIIIIILKLHSVFIFLIIKLHPTVLFFHADGTLKRLESLNRRSDIKFLKYVLNIDISYFIRYG